MANHCTRHQLVVWVVRKVLLTRRHQAMGFGRKLRLHDNGGESKNIRFALILGCGRAALSNGGAPAEQDRLKLSVIRHSFIGYALWQFLSS